MSKCIFFSSSNYTRKPLSIHHLIISDFERFHSFFIPLSLLVVLSNTQEKCVRKHCSSTINITMLILYRCKKEHKKKHYYALLSCTIRTLFNKSIYKNVKVYYYIFLFIQITKLQTKQTHRGAWILL